MKVRIDGVRLLVLGAFLLLGAAIGSLIWSGKIARVPTKVKPVGKVHNQVNKQIDPDLACLNNPIWLNLNRKLVEAYRQKQYLGAIKVAGEAYQMAEKTFGAGHPGTAIATSNLALVYLRQERFDEAAWLFKQTVSIVNGFESRGQYRNLKLKDSGLLSQSDDYEMWDWPPADYRVEGIAPGMSEEEVRKILEKFQPVEETPIPGQSQTGADGKELVYPQCKTRFTKIQTGLKLGQIVFTGQDAATFRGIRIGDPKRAVIWVYGRPQKEEPGFLEYICPVGTAEKPLERYIRLKLDDKAMVQEIEVGER